MIKLTDEQAAQLYRAECLLAEAASLLDCIANDDSIVAQEPDLRVQDLHDSHEQAYGAMCTLANLRTDRESQQRAKFGAKCSD